MNKKKLLALLMALVMTLTLVPVTAFAEGDQAAASTTGYNGAELPAGPDMSGNVINVTAANAQYVLDGAYGDINGKTINFTENVTDALDLARPTKYSGSGTTSTGNTYSRTLSNVTFTAVSGVELAGFYFHPGHIYGNDDFTKYNYVEDRSVTSTNDGYYRHSTLSKITFSGLTVKGSATTAPFDFIGSLDNATVSEITFNGCTITNDNGNAIQFNNNGNLRYGTITISNCNINGSGIGVYVNSAGDGTITLNNNIIFGGSNNAIQITRLSDGTGSVSITGNYLKSNKYAVNLNNYTSETITLTGNAVVAGTRGHLGHFKGDASGNFWAPQGTTLTENNTVTTTLSSPTADTQADQGENEITCSSAFDTALLNTSADKWVTLSNSASTAVAKIGSQEYETLQAAIDAAADGATIELLKDITLSNAKTIDSNSTYGVAIDKSLTLDGKNFTITSNATRTIGIKGASAENKISVTIKNLTINNSNTAGSGIFTRGNLNSLTMDNVKVYCKSTSGYNQPLTISGNRNTEETNNTANIIIQNNCYLQSAPNCEVGYAVINWVPANISIIGSTIKGWACLYAKPGSDGTTFTVDNSNLISSNQNAGNTNSFGVIVFEDNNVTATVTNTAIDVSGTKNTQGIAVFNTLYADRSTLFYEGTNYNLYYLNNTKLTLGVGNTVIMKEDAEFATNSANDGYYWCGELEIKGGIFDKEPDAQYIADGYKAVALTGDNEGKFQVGPATITTSKEGTADKLTYNVDSVVKESDESDVPIETTNNMTVTVVGNDTEKTNKDGSGVDKAALSSIKSNALDKIVTDAIEAAGSSITSSTSEANIVIQLAKSAPEKETNKVTFEVHPEAVITVAGSNKSTTVALSNEQLDNTKPFTFTLDVSALGVANGDKVKVTHKHGGSSTELGEYLVEGGKITISGIESFSEFEVTTVDEYEGTVTLKFEGTGLRRRVRLNASVESNEVVRSSTDARFGFSWTLPGGYSVEQNSSYFRWSRDGVNWKEVPMAKNYNYTANLVITGIPSDAFNTPIYTELTLAYRDTNSTLKTITLSANARSVVDVANSLKSLTPNDDNNKWIDYAKYLLCDGINSYSIIDDGNGYDAQ